MDLKNMYLLSTGNGQLLLIPFGIESTFKKDIQSRVSLLSIYHLLSNSLFHTSLMYPSRAILCMYKQLEVYSLKKKFIIDDLKHTQTLR